MTAMWRLATYGGTRTLAGRRRHDPGGVAANDGDEPDLPVPPNHPQAPIGARWRLVSRLGAPPEPLLAPRHPSRDPRSPPTAGRRAGAVNVGSADHSAGCRIRTTSAEVDGWARSSNARERVTTPAERAGSTVAAALAAAAQARWAAAERSAPGSTAVRRASAPGTMPAMRSARAGDPPVAPPRPVKPGPRSARATSRHPAATATGRRGRARANGFAAASNRRPRGGGAPRGRWPVGNRSRRPRDRGPTAEPTPTRTGQPDGSAWRVTR